MTIAGVTVPTVTLTLSLPTTRVDGTDANLSDIASVTILRDSGSGPATLATLNGPFSGLTVSASDPSPATGNDVYSFFAVDTAGTQGDTSPPVTVSISGSVPLARLSAGSMTAVADVAPAAPVSEAEVKK